MDDSAQNPRLGLKQATQFRLRNCKVVGPQNSIRPPTSQRRADLNPRQRTRLAV